MSLLAIDPGPALSAWVELRDGKPVAFGHDPTPEVEARARAWVGPLAVEMIASYGMAVGAEVFDTCVAIGRMDWDRRAMLVERGKIKMHHCRSMRANDSNIRQAMLDRFGGSGAVGKKKSPGLLYGVSGDVWAALALALYVYDVERAL